MNSHHLFRCFFALLAIAFATTASAENEAWYFPNGMFYVPYVKMQDKQGNTVATYAAFLKKYGSGWKFKLDGLSEVSAATESAGTNYVTVTNYVTNYVIVSNFVNSYWHGRITTTYDGTNTIVWTNFALSNPPALTGVTGTWDFTFNETWERTYTGTEFDHTTNAAPIPTDITLTLTQDGADVEGTGTVGSVQYSLAGEVTNDFFVFTMLAGTADAKVTLAEVRALVGDEIMIGNYSWSTADGAKVQIGDFTANRQ